jgi:tetraacyldisaccharide 4'-kinase
MAVCENRVEGVNKLVQIHPSIQAVVLDDGFQHRALKASVYILTTQFGALFSTDFLFPMGYLRDNRREAKRAAAIVVTKCPPDLSKLEREKIEKKIRQSPNQSIFFTSTVYGDPLPVFDHLPPFDKSKGVIAFSGLAQNSEFQNAVNGSFSLKKFKDYPDHHQYGVADVALFDKEMHTFDPRSVILLTTEKDAVKWSEIKEAHHLPLYFLPITMSFLEREEEFVNAITRSIR